MCGLFSALFFTAYSQDTISIVLNSAVPGKTIAPDFAGLSFEKNVLNKNYFSAHKDTLIRFFQTLGLQSIRIGGNSVDKDTLSSNATSTHFTRAEIDSLYGFIKNVPCKTFIGVNFGGDFNPSLSSTEVSYLLQHYSSSITGFEIGNEADLYYSNGFRPSTYNVAAYETQYNQYRDTILKYNPLAIFTGPTAATHYSTFTLPFCRNMKGKFSMLTQHYYVGAANAAPVRQQVVKLLSAATLNAVVTEVKNLVQCADSSGIPFRMGECNSFYNGGQWSVSDAFASALWALDYMYALAKVGCAGVNFHGALGGPYTAISYKNKLYSARPIYYGILAFQTGSKGKFISQTVTNNHINLNAYSVLDSSGIIYTTIINKDTLQNAVINLDAGNTNYNSSEFIQLSSSSLTDTITTKLGGQVVSANGTCSSFSWQALTMSNHKIQVLVAASSATIVKFIPLANGMHLVNTRKDMLLYPNPSDGSFYLQSESNLPEPSKAEIYSSSGKKVMECAVQGKQNKMNVEELTNGVYFLQLWSNQTLLYRTTIIIER